jgi:hypothetical protein
MQREILLLTYANKKDITLTQVKAQLAQVAMNVQLKKELAAADIQMKQDENMHDRTHDLNKHVATLASQGATQPDVLPETSSPV